MSFTPIAIVAIIAWAIVNIVEANSSSKKAKKQKSEKEENVALKSEVDSLKERIEVLEKIVTDENYDLKKQFRDLERDKVA